MYTGVGFIPIPTPGGVPVKIKSPGLSVTIFEMYDTTVCTLKINSRVLESCTFLSFTKQRIPKLLGLNESAGERSMGLTRMEGPIGAKVSHVFPT